MKKMFEKSVSALIAVFLFSLIASTVTSQKVSAACMTACGVSLACIIVYALFFYEQKKVRR